MMKRLLWLVILIVFGLSACGQGDGADVQQPGEIQITINAPDESEQGQPEEQLPYPAPDEEPATQVDGAYPPPPPTRVSPYPETPQSEASPSAEIEAGPFTIPEPGEDSGVVVGQMFRYGTDEPLGGYTIYLAELLPLDPGDGYLVSLQQGKSPNAKSYPDGMFAIGDVPPGTYTIVLWTPFDANSVKDEETGMEIQIDVEAGKTLELGPLEIVWP